MKKKLYLRVAIAGLIISAIVFRGEVKRAGIKIYSLIRGEKTVDERVSQFSSAVHQRLLPDFKELGIDYPPNRITLVGLKREKRLEVWVSDGEEKFHHLKNYPILAASGKLGPKLREGDKQVPEGIYKIESLHPNSLFHLALRLDYPNDFDKEKGIVDGRENLGSDIMIHGSDVSIGCLAMGDEAAEDLFVLAAETGIENISVILSPVDFRNSQLPEDAQDPPKWTANLYKEIKARLIELNEN